MEITDEMVNRADSVLSRVRGGIPDETIRLALEAALSAAEPWPAPSVAVKALEWVHGGATDLLYERWEARSLLGPYLIVKINKGFEWYLVGRTGMSTNATLNEAQSAAQADYEARIRSALA